MYWFAVVPYTCPGYFKVILSPYLISNPRVKLPFKKDVIPQSHLLYGGRMVAVELQNRVIPAVAVEFCGGRRATVTVNPYVLQAAGVAVEL